MRARYWLSFFIIFGFTALSHAASDITSVEKYFLEERYEKTADAAGKLIEAGARDRDELYYLKGLSEMKLSRFNQARDTFNRLAEKYPRSDRAFDAKLGIADSYFLEGRRETARRSYEELSSGPRGRENARLLRARIDACDSLPAPSAAGPVQNFTPKNETRPAIATPRADAAHISIQIGCFKNKSNAEGLRAKLSKAGYETRVEAPAGDGLWRVKVGRFATLEDAERTRIRLKRDGYDTKVCDNP